VLASSAKADELATYKKLAGIDDLIDTETSADDAQRSKPSPDIFLAALERLEGIRREDVLAVGDTPYDAEAAGKAGLHTIGLLCGGWSEEDLRRASCVAIYEDPADLLAHYDESPLARDDRSA
jgi:phosphoglycolate phosphatase-like HAD superfamily hydrolase